MKKDYEEWGIIEDEECNCCECCECTCDEEQPVRKSKFISGTVTRFKGEIGEVVHDFQRELAYGEEFKTIYKRGAVQTGDEYVIYVASTLPLVAERLAENTIHGDLPITNVNAVFNGTMPNYDSITITGESPVFRNFVINITGITEEE
jgi:hypothetical protein